jgi:DNA-binding beta-propeller fold protein YncE
LLASNGALQYTYNVGANPFAIAYDGSYMWITNTGANTVLKIRPLIRGAVTATTLPTQSYPVGVAFDGVNMWIANYNSGTVSKM